MKNKFEPRDNAIKPEHLFFYYIEEILMYIKVEHNFESNEQLKKYCRNLLRETNIQAMYKKMIRQFDWPESHKHNFLVNHFHQKQHDFYDSQFINLILCYILTINFTHYGILKESFINKLVDTIIFEVFDFTSIGTIPEIKRILNI